MLWIMIGIFLAPELAVLGAWIVMAGVIFYRGVKIGIIEGHERIRLKQQQRDLELVR